MNRAAPSTAQKHAMDVDQVEAVIFDLDGTLVDSLDDIAAATNRTLARFGMPTHGREAFGQMIGEGVARLIEQALPIDARSRLDEILDAYRLDYAAHLLDATRPYPGIANLLRQLEAAEVPMAILSNKPDGATQTIVSSLLGDIRFVQVRGERAALPRKPNPCSALEIAALLDVLPKRCGFVGDTAIDMQTAIAANMVPIGVSWGFRGEAELWASGAQLVLKHPNELWQRVRPRAHAGTQEQGR